MNRKLKKIAAVSIILFLVLLVFTPFSAGADSGQIIDLGDEIEDILAGQLESSGAYELFDEIPSETEEYMEELGITDISISSILSININQVFDLVIKIIKDYFRGISGIFATIMGVIVISVIVDIMKDDFLSSKIGEVFGIVSVLCLVTIVSTPIISVISKVINAIESGTVFISALLPVLSGVMMAGGQVVTGTTYNLLIYGVCQAVSGLASTVIVPLISIYLGFCITSSVSTKMNLDGAAKNIKSLASWMLGLAVTVFVGILTAQTLVTTSADSAISKAGKFLVNSTVPIIGGPLSDAVATVQGCLALIKNIVGVFGIFSAFLIFLPVLLECLMWMALLQVTAFVADMFSINSIATLMRSVCSAMSLLCTVLICSGVLVIISTTVVLLLGGRGV